MLLDLDSLRSRTKNVERPVIGIYFLFDGEDLVYVGQSNNVLSRVQTHAAKSVQFDRYAVVECQLNELNELEGKYITQYKPKLNKRMPCEYSDNLLGPKHPIMPGWRLRRRAIPVIKSI
jgi:hypothetical protein